MVKVKPFDDLCTYLDVLCICCLILLINIFPSLSVCLKNHKSLYVLIFYDCPRTGKMKNISLYTLVFYCQSYQRVACPDYKNSLVIFFLGGFFDET